MGAGGDGPLGGMAGMEPHHINGSLGTLPNVHTLAAFHLNSVDSFSKNVLYFASFVYPRVRRHGQPPQGQENLLD